MSLLVILIILIILINLRPLNKIAGLLLLNGGRRVLRMHWLRLGLAVFSSHLYPR
jgi:hypothetical protein